MHLERAEYIIYENFVCLSGVIGSFPRAYVVCEFYVAACPTCLKLTATWHKVEGKVFRVRTLETRVVVC